MRKIERDMLAAIRSGKSKSIGNTTVRCNDGGAWTVLLHGNLIAERRADGTLNVTLAGWNTPTTRSRLNAILSEFALGANTGYPWRISCRSFEPYLNGQPIGADEWINVA